MLYNFIKDHYKQAEPIFFSDLLRENIKYYINWVISNVNSDTGVVDETSAYNVMHKITVNYNK